MRPGICSVTLRRQDIDSVVAISAAAGLQAIEWGGDVHVPPGDDAAADRARKRTADAGLAVASYGSYYRSTPDERAAIAPVVATALRLGAPRIRIWAGTAGSTEVSTADGAAVVDGAAAMVAAAAEVGIEVAFEFHRGTLTDDVASTNKLLAEVGGAGSYWQPPVGLPDDAALETLEAVLPAVRAQHVFAWWPQNERLPLAERAALWRRAFALAPDMDALLEFVPDDDPDLVAREAATLHDLIHGGP